MNFMNIPEFNEIHINEPLSTYYFVADQQNNQNIILPIFVKTSFQTIVSSVSRWFQSLLVLLTKLYTMLTLTLSSMFETNVDAPIYAIGYLVKSIFTPVYELLKRTFIFHLTFIDKIVIGFVAVYFILISVISIFKQKNELLEQIETLEQQIILLKKRDRQREDDVGYLLTSKTLFQKMEQKQCNMENKMKQIVKKIHQIKNISN